MTAHELARQLFEGPDVMVVHNGHEQGVYEVRDLNPIQIHLDIPENKGRWYYGDHEECEGPNRNDFQCSYCASFGDPVAAVKVSS